MSRVFRDIKVGLDDDLEQQLQWLSPDMGTFRILRESVDARKRHKPHLVYTVEVFGKDEPPKPVEFHLDKVKWRHEPPLVIGAGPAGLFAAYRLAERGIPCRLIEQGSIAEKRIHSINKFWRYGKLDPVNNVCFGEGGAGLYSDGKLITRIKSPYIPYVLNRLVQCGAPAEIEYAANPHVGSDRLRRIIPVLRSHLQQLGVEMHFDTKMKRLLVESRSVVGIETADGRTFRSPAVILATGHSAEDIYELLAEQGVFIEGKSFALGLRIEHPQKHIDNIQYGNFAGHPKLGSANYKLTHKDKKTSQGIYSFCMCPGGYVLSSGTNVNGVVANGMSNYKRNSPFANAAVVVTVNHSETFGTDPWGGLKMRRHIESEALQMVVATGGTKEVPAQKLDDFLSKKTGTVLPSSCPSKVMPAPLHQLLPPHLYGDLVRGLENFDRKMKGFISDEAQLHGVESRTSSPLRITRDAARLHSVSHHGLYPCGEGAGYAGGITSAACDGVRVAEQIILNQI